MDNLGETTVEEMKTECIAPSSKQDQKQDKEKTSHMSAKL